MTTPSTSSATRRLCVIRNSPDAFSPVRTSIGIFSLVLEKVAKSLASCSKARNTSKPARIAPGCAYAAVRSEEHTSELQSQSNLVCRLLLEKKNTKKHKNRT